MNTCTPAFERLASAAGGINCTDSGLISLRNPFALHHPTMPLIEIALIVGAVASLVHAMRIRKRAGVSTNLILWWAATLCPLLIEPIVYFPETFGIQDSVGLTFIHNQFTVTFLFNRLPIYIIAMYPVYIYAAFLIAQRAGVDRRPILGASVVAFSFVVLYEVIDQVGPQFQWWIWNYDVPSGLPRLGAVPLSSITGFSIGVPFGVTLGSIWATRTSNDRVVRKIVGVSLWSCAALLIAGMPTSLYARFVNHGTATICGTATLFILCGIGTIWALRPSFLSSVASEDHGEPHGRFLEIVTATYMILGVVFWAIALPGYLAATDGVAPGAGQVGSFPVALAGACTSVALVAAANRIARRAHAAPVTPAPSAWDPRRV